MNTTYKEKSVENAKKAKTFAGKRFLGFTPKGAEVWISMELNRENMELSITTTHDLDVLLEEGAELANRRVTVKKGSPSLSSARDLLRRSQRNESGEVTPTTISYLKKLMNAVEIKFRKGHVKGIPTTLLFMYVSNAIFEGSVDIDNGGFAWSYVLSEWGLPKGEYFTVDEVMPIKEVS